MKLDEPSHSAHDRHGELMNRVASRAARQSAREPATKHVEPMHVLKQAGDRSALAAGVDYNSEFQFGHNSDSAVMPKGHWEAFCILVAIPEGAVDCSVCKGLKVRIQADCDAHRNF